MIDENNRLRNNSNKLKKELKFLNDYECKIITKLRTEYINLNSFKKHYFKETNGNCEICNCHDTVEHYLMECLINDKMQNKITEMRNKFWYDMKKIHSFFKFEMNKNIINILFPNSWLFEPLKDDKKYYDKIKKNQETRIKILKRLCKFVIDCGRFENDEYGI